MKEIIKYDKLDRPIEVSYTNDEGNPTENLYGVASMRSTYLSDDNLYSREERSYDIAGNSTEDKLGVHMIRRIWDPIHRMETETYHNLQGELVEISYGFCEVHYHLDEQMQPHSVYCYKKNGELVEEPGKGIALTARF